MHRVPAPARQIAAQPRAADRPAPSSQRLRHASVARLLSRRVARRRTMGSRRRSAMLVTKRVMYEKRPSYVVRDERPELVADERRRELAEPGLENRRRRHCRRWRRSSTDREARPPAGARDHRPRVREQQRQQRLRVQRQRVGLHLREIVRREAASSARCRSVIRCARYGSGYSSAIRCG